MIKEMFQMFFIAFGVTMLCLCLYVACFNPETLTKYEIFITAMFALEVTFNHLTVMAKGIWKKRKEAKKNDSKDTVF